MKAITNCALGLFAGTVALGCLSVAAEAGEPFFPSENMRLMSHMPLSQFDSAISGNDCWGYVSPSGREYALMGLFNSMAVVEITDAASPVLIDQIFHTGSTWGDYKTYGTFAYAVNESGGGLDVIDLSEVDDGTVTLVQRITVDGLNDVHNIAVDEHSGFLYLCLPNINDHRLVAMDLTDPANPVIAGMMSDAGGAAGLHDAQVVTYTDGPFAGRQVCFGAAEGRGLDVIDVTDKSNMFLITRLPYPNVAYAHQCWLSEDRQYLYLNDEGDETGFSEIATTRTLVFDVADVENPVLAGTFSSGLGTIDHNLYVHNGFVFEANYHSGLQVFDAAVDPLSPPRVAFFDTYPQDDGLGFGGAWSCYPFFPSGTIIVSDTIQGLFVLRFEDCNDNGVPDSDEIAADRSLDCNLNGVLDECDIAEGTSPDENRDGVPDECSDCNGNGQSDIIDIADGTSNDCNGNVTPDECEEDCNRNGVPDDCDVRYFTATTGPLSPIGAGAPVSFTVPASPENLGDVTLIFTASADLAGETRYIDVRLNTASLVTIFMDEAGGCPDEADRLIVNYDRSRFRILRNFDPEGDLNFEFVASDGVDATACNDGSFLTMQLQYEAELDNDQNGNGVPDECDPPTCQGEEATVYVDMFGTIVGGHFDGLPYFGILLGTHENDVMVGTDGADIIVGLQGDDIICGLGGDDVINANNGDDSIDGGEGFDHVHGNGGADSCINGEQVAGCEDGDNSARIRRAFPSESNSRR